MTFEQCKIGMVIEFNNGDEVNWVETIIKIDEDKEKVTVDWHPTGSYDKNYIDTNGKLF